MEISSVWTGRNPSRSPKKKKIKNNQNAEQKMKIASVVKVTEYN
jgi:hypothetical protein